MALYLPAAWDLGRDRLTRLAIRAIATIAAVALETASCAGAHRTRRRSRSGSHGIQLTTARAPAAQIYRPALGMLRGGARLPRAGCRRCARWYVSPHEDAALRRPRGLRCGQTANEELGVQSGAGGG